MWSHQFNGRGARSPKDLVEERCYQGASIRPLPETVARDFRIDEDRAPPAHVERVAGRRLDDVGQPGTPGAPATREARLRAPTTIAAAAVRTQ